MSGSTSAAVRGPRSALVPLTVAAALWGTAGTATKFALRGFDPITLLTVELMAGATVLVVTLLIRGYRPPASWRRVIVLGLCEPTVAYLGETMGLTRTSASNAAIIAGMESMFVVLLAAVFLRERLSAVLVGAAAVTVAGLVVLESSARFSGPGLGDLLVLGGVLSAAGYSIVARSGADADSVAVTAHQFAVAALAIAPITLVLWSTGAEAAPTHVEARYWVAALAVGAAGYAGSFLLYNRVIVSTPASSASVIVNLIPVFGLVSAVLWLRDALTVPRLVGVALIGTAVAVFVAAEGRDEPVGVS